MHEENYRMIMQVQLIYNAVEAYRKGFEEVRVSIEKGGLEESRKELLLKSLEAPYIECVLLFDKDEEIHSETMRYIHGLGLDLQECTSDERHYRSIPKNVDAYKLVGRLAY